jgi:preprotein translocase subunit SecG
MNWIGIITKLLTAVNLIVCLLIVLLVLLQRPKNEGLGAAFGGDTAGNLFGAQTTNVLATLTRWMGAIFLGLCLVIAVLGTHDKDRQGKIGAYIDKIKLEQAERDKQKASEEAAKAAAAAVEAAKNPPMPATGTSAPVQIPLGAPALPNAENPAPGTTPPAEAPKPEPAKPADTKPIEPKSEPKPEVPKSDSPKPAEKPAEPKPAEKPADPKPPGN